MAGDLDARNAGRRLSRQHRAGARERDVPAVRRGRTLPCLRYGNSRRLPEDIRAEHPRRRASATATCCRSRRPARSASPSPTTPRTASSRRIPGSTPARSASPTGLDARIPRRGPRLAALEGARRQRPRRCPTRSSTPSRSPARDHMKMQAAIQPFDLTRRSPRPSTCPRTYPFEAFESLYLEAWTRRPQGDHHLPAEQRASARSCRSRRTAPQDLDQTEPDRRIRINDAPQVALAALRWPHRPKLSRRQRRPGPL